jgi:hypothetical protein
MFKNFPAVAAWGSVDAELGPDSRETLAHVTFGAFIGAFGLLLILFFSSVPVVGS